MVEVVSDGVVQSTRQVPRLDDPVVVFTPAEERVWRRECGGGNYVEEESVWRM